MKIINKRKWGCGCAFWVSFFFAGGVMGQVTDTDGDWSAQEVILFNTPEADAMVRSGDIDNLGFGWPQNYDPFSGNSTPGHSFPWQPEEDDVPGTDRIMVITSYNGVGSRDGYTSSTSRPNNQVVPIILEYDLQGLPVVDASLQIFIDDFQASVWGADYQVLINNKRSMGLESLINSAVQTGPVGKLITFPIPGEFLSDVQAGLLSLVFDDLTSGAGDGYAIDFVKLLVNRKSGIQTGRISGVVLDSVSRSPIAGAAVTVFDQSAITGGDGSFLIESVPSGLAFIEASARTYFSGSKLVDVITGTTTSGVEILLEPGNLSLEIHPAVEISFDSSLGVTYEIQFSSDMEIWMLDETLEGTGERITLCRRTDANHRFWRALQKP